MAVDLDGTHADTGGGAPADQAEEEPGHLHGAVDGGGQGGRLAAAVAVHHDVVGEQPDQALDVALLDRSKNRRASSSRWLRDDSNRGRPASTWRRALAAIWRQLSSDLPTSPAISA